MKIALMTSESSAELLKFQENNGYLNDIRLESFGYFLDNYVIRGAELSFDKANPMKLILSEGIISQGDQLWRSFTAEHVVTKRGATIYVGFMEKKGYIVGEQEPNENYMRLWSFDTTIDRQIKNIVDHRGPLGRIKFKADYDGVIFNIAEVQDAIDDAIKAKDDTYIALDDAKKQLDESIKTTENRLREWKYADNYNPSLSYKMHNVVSMAGNTYIAIKDVAPGVNPTDGIYDPNWRLQARAGADGTGTVVMHEDMFISSLNQKTFQLTHPYDQYQNRIEVTAGGVPQFSKTNFDQTTPTSITFNTGIPLGIEVVVRYFSKAQPLGTDLETKVTQLTGQVSTILDDMTSDIDGGLFTDTTTGVLVDGGVF